MHDLFVDPRWCVTGTSLKDDDALKPDRVRDDRVVYGAVCSAIDVLSTTPRTETHDSLVIRYDAAGAILMLTFC